MSKPPTEIDLAYAGAMARGLVGPARSLELRSLPMDSVTAFHRDNDTMWWSQYTAEVREEEFITFLRREALGNDPSQSVIVFTATLALEANKDFSPDIPPQCHPKPGLTVATNDLLGLMSGSSDAEQFSLDQLKEVLVAILGAGGMARDQMSMVLPGVEQGGKRAFLKMIQDLTKK